MAKVPFQLLLHAKHPERRRGEVLSVARPDEEESSSLVSSARMLDGTIDTLTLVEG